MKDQKMVMQEQMAYPIEIGNDESVGLTIVAVGNPLGRIGGIRVQDVGRQIWFAWDWGVWDQAPSCVPGVGKLYVAFYAYNQGDLDGNLTLTLRDDTGAILAQRTVWCAVGQGVGIEWTGNMPTRDYGITCIVTP